MLMALVLGAGGLGCGPTVLPDTEDVLVSREARALQAVTCKRFQRGLGGLAADAEISSRQPRRAQGSLPLAQVGSLGPHEQQLLLRFDMGAIPASAVVHSATLTLWQKAPGDGSLRAHAVTRAWEEGTVTWEGFGGGYSSAVAGTLQAGRQGPRTLELKGLAAAWVRNGALNHGVLLEQEEGRTLFDTSEVPCGRAASPARGLLLGTGPCAPEHQRAAARARCAGPASARGRRRPRGARLHATDGAGWLLLEQVPPGRFVALVEALEHAPASVSVELRAGPARRGRGAAAPAGGAHPFLAEEGLTAQQGAVRVGIPPSALGGRGRPDGDRGGRAPGDAAGSHPGHGRIAGPARRAHERWRHRGLESAFMAEVSLESEGRAGRDWRPVPGRGSNSRCRWRSPPAISR